MVLRLVMATVMHGNPHHKRSVARTARGDATSG